MEYVPPYGSEGALYLRPLLFGTGARIGLQPSDEYTLLVMAIPVGNYYKVRHLVFLFPPVTRHNQPLRGRLRVPPFFLWSSYMQESEKNYAWVVRFCWGGRHANFQRVTSDKVESRRVHTCGLLFSVGRVQANDSGGDRGLRPGGPQGRRRRQGGRKLRGGHDAEHAGQAGRLPHRALPGCQDEHTHRGAFSSDFGIFRLLGSGISRRHILAKRGSVVFTSERLVMGVFLFFIFFLFGFLVKCDNVVRAEKS